MRSILTLGSLLLLAPSFAQITIGAADMPSAGDTMRYRNTAAAGIDVDLTGADVIWDFSDLSPDLEGADTAVAVTSTPFAYQLFFNNPILYPQHQANFAMKGQDFSFQTFLTVSNLYDYYKKDATGYRNVGFGANINGLPSSTRRVPVDFIHRFPMNFGDQDSSFSSFTLTVPTLFSFSQDQLRINTVDGWGTIYLPADTFQVLRVRSVLQRSDSIYVNQFGQGFRIDEPETVEYKWIAQGMDVPVLIVTTLGGQATTARFYYDPEGVGTSVSQIAGTVQLAVYPNPANGLVTVDVPTGVQGVLELVDATGRVVLAGPQVLGGTTAQMDLSGLANGSYTLRMAGSATAWSTRVHVQH
ncbi:MAG: T9SS type A sorting domain-containing protein [Flavobacteriales bacterium]